MDLTPDVLHEQEFREARRGYDMREVDDFLERVAVAVAELLERLRGVSQEVEHSKARIAELEAEVRDAANRPADADETLQRTLVLAQKTADAAIAEAEEKAAKTLARAEQQAALVLKEAEQAAERSRIESESQARRAGEETRRRMIEEITALERDRETLNSDVRALRRYLDDQRTRMRTAARDLLRLVEDPTALKAFEPPEVGGAEAGPDEPDTDAPETVDDGEGDESSAVEGTEGAGPASAGDDDDYFEDLRRAMNEGDDANETSDA